MLKFAPVPSFVPAAGLASLTTLSTSATRGVRGFVCNAVAVVTCGFKFKSVLVSPGAAVRAPELKPVVIPLPLPVCGAPEEMTFVLLEVGCVAESGVCLALNK